MSPRVTIPAVAALLAVYAAEVRAADTVEGWAPGPTNTEVYAGYTGIGPGRNERGPQVEFLQGFGFGHTLSAFLSATVEAAGSTSAGFAASLFGTPLDTDHVDIDLMLVLGQEWRRLEDFALGTAFELNLDLAPDLSLWGVYLRGCVHLGGGLHVGVETTLGTYVTLSERHQLLLEADAEFVVNAGDRQGGVQIGGIALGYNIVVHEDVELITEIFLDIPQPGGSFSTGVMLGLILTLPFDGPFDRLGAAGR